MQNRRWTPEMTRNEQIGGMVFFVLYILVFPTVKMGVERFFDRLFGLYLSEAMSAAVYYLILACFTVLLFRRFLSESWAVLLDALPENLVIFFTALLGGVVLHVLVALLPYPVENPAAASWAGQYAYSPAATVVIVVFLTPLIEEVLFRGLLYGLLRPYSTALSWTVSVLLFALYNVWTFAVTFGDVRYLALAVQYFPIALALTWSYERSGSIWPAILLHAVINAFILFQAIS